MDDLTREKFLNDVLPIIRKDLGDEVADYCLVHYNSDVHKTRSHMASLLHEAENHVYREEILETYRTIGQRTTT